MWRVTTLLSQRRLPTRWAVLYLMNMPPKFEQPTDNSVKIATLRQKIHELAGRSDWVEIHDEKLVPFVERLRKRYGEEKVQGCQLCHLLIGSTVPRGEPLPIFDFSDEDSIEAFINGLAETFAKKRANE